MQLKDWNVQDCAAILIQSRAIYKKYTGYKVKETVKKDGEKFACNLAMKFELRVQPALESSLRPGTFIYI